MRYNVSIMLTMLLAATVMAQGPATVCPVMGDPISENSQRYEYAGLVTAVCCAGCEGSLKAAPDKAMKARGTSLVAYSAYDVIAKTSIKPDKAVATTDYNGVRYLFSTKENKAAFDKDPKALSTRPTYEAFGKCVVTKEVVPAGKFAAYRDVKTVIDGKPQMARVYFCCMGCVPKFDDNPSNYTADLKYTKVTIHEIK